MRHTALAALLVAALMTIALSACNDITTLYPLSNGITLKSVSMVSSNEGWAVGEKGGLPNHILLHYSKGQWTVVKPIPEQTATMPGIHTALTGVVMVSSSEGWAIGTTDIPSGPLVTAANGTSSQAIQPAGVLLHYTKGKWNVANGNLASKPLAIKMLSSTQGWILSTDIQSTNVVLLHYDGLHWMPMTLPHSVENMSSGLDALSVLAANNIWIAGAGGNAFHYDGQTWTQSTACSNCALLSIAMLSANEGWAVGGIYNSQQGVIYHYQYGQWILQSNANTPGLDIVTMFSSSDGWANGSGNMLHYTGGQWVPVSIPTQYGVNQIAMLSSNEGWAVGQLGVILHYQNGSWTLDTNVVYQPDAWAIYSEK